MTATSPRLQWCRTRLSWSDTEWQRVIFSDESRFSLGGDAQRICVWRHRGQHRDGRFVVTRPEGLVSFHLTPTAPSAGTVSKVNVAVYQEGLEPFILPAADQLYGDADFIFQQDSAPAHSAKATSTWFKDHGSSDVSRSVGDSVQLDIQLPVPEFDDFIWVFNRTTNILKYYKETNRTKAYPGYEGRVEFNYRNYSLTLKNLQKTDRGLYEARASAAQVTVVAEYRLSVLDPVEAPVLNPQSSNYTCNITLTCRGHDLSISSSCNTKTCEEKEVTSPRGITLSLSINGSSIICNHSNPVSWKEAVLETVELERLCADGGGTSPLNWLLLGGGAVVIIIIIIIIIITLTAVFIRLCLRRRKSTESCHTDLSGFVGNSVQLDTQEPVPEFASLTWLFNRTNNIVEYIKEFKRIKPSSGYKDRVEFNEGNYSLTLKNLQKTDSGLYEARVSGDQVTVVAGFSLSVLGSSNVSRSVGDSVQLDIQRPVAEFDDIIWRFNSNNILKYYKEINKTRPFPGYEDRVEFNYRTYSLTLKNLQKTDSGLYEARASDVQVTVVAEYRLSVLGKCYSVEFRGRKNAVPTQHNTTTPPQHILLSSVTMTVLNTTSPSPKTAVVSYQTVME
ncbi:hypothetical protein NFI96_028859 [Prochilodus magdalenae]|nr:hypothetical protein NFI96_028859 [Prochilodus magdalenae]